MLESPSDPPSSSLLPLPLPDLLEEWPKSSESLPSAATVGLVFELPDFAAVTVRGFDPEPNIYRSRSMCDQQEEL